MAVEIIEALLKRIFDAVAGRITGKPWVFDFSDRLLEKSQHYPKTQCHRLHVDVPEEILLYPQAKLYPLSKFEFGIAACFNLTMSKGGFLLPSASCLLKSKCCITT
ncbi:MAG: hypothetical protein ACYTXT_39535 [Nostoc sp.]